MEILNMDYTFTKGVYKNKKVSELVDIKGCIISLIKDGYYFDDEVLEAACIKKVIRDVKYIQGIERDAAVLKEVVLPKETASVKQILSEINTLNSIGNEKEYEKDAAEETDNENEDNEVNYDEDDE